MHAGAHHVIDQVGCLAFVQAVPAFQTHPAIVFVFKLKDLIRWLPCGRVFEVEAVTVLARTPAPGCGDRRRGAIQHSVTPQAGNDADPQALHLLQKVDVAVLAVCRDNVQCFWTLCPQAG